MVVLARRPLEPEVGTPPPAPDAVQFAGVVKRYGQVVALDDVNLRLGRGETIALLGPNGAGKSTAIGVMLGLLRPDAGTVTVLGGTPEAAVQAGQVGAMLQEGGLLPGVTVGELIDFIRHVYPSPLPADEVLGLAGLTELRRRRVNLLSGGQAQRVRFAMAIAGDPELIFLDEPTTGMDVETRRSFWESMRAFAASGRTILFATHYLEEADAVADRVIVLSHGRIVAAGAATEIKATVGLRDVRFTLPQADRAGLSHLPGVVEAEIHGDAVRLESNDADATVRALCAAELPFRDIEVTGAGLEDAFLALTRE